MINNGAAMYDEGLWSLFSFHDFNGLGACLFLKWIFLISSNYVVYLFPAFSTPCTPS
jgi:hypothetical protein